MNDDNLLLAYARIKYCNEFECKLHRQKSFFFEVDAYVF